MFGLPFLSTKLLIQGGCVLAIVAALGFGGWSVVHSIKVGAVKDIVAADTAHAAQVDAAGAKIDAAQSAVDAHSSEVSATHQTAIAVSAAVVKQKVRTHVHEPLPTAPPAVGCVTYGLVRQHDAAALGVDPDTLPLPSGVTDDTCSPVANADLADAIADNYAAARANAAQLDDLEANVKAKVDATARPK
jgi:hypothetical protein